MISVQEATQIIQKTVRPTPETLIPLDQSIGYVLREPVFADRDFPPYDRVTMDGIAFRFSDWQGAETRFLVEGIQHAGDAQMTLQAPGNCIEIMTGAVCPAGTDCVVRYEDVEFSETGGRRYARLTVPPTGPGQNVHPQGNDRSRGDVLIEAGRVITAAEIATAATVGKTHLKVSQLPRTAIVSTGDELVEIDQAPLPHQIRRSNVYMLQAALRDLNIEATRYHFADDLLAVKNGLEALLQGCDLIVLSGGVSMGKADYLPQALQELGVTQLFHKVSQRPGKPFWFGTHPKGAVVFALPGNPVSSFLGAYRYIRPWIWGRLQAAPVPALTATLSDPFHFAPSLTYFLQVQASTDEAGRLWARPAPGMGSGDLANLLECNAFLELPHDRNDFAPGESYPLIPFRRL